MGNNFIDERNTALLGSVAPIIYFQGPYYLLFVQSEQKPPLLTVETQRWCCGDIDMNTCWRVVGKVFSMLLKFILMPFPLYDLPPCVLSLFLRKAFSLRY